MRSCIQTGPRRLPHFPSRSSPTSVASVVATPGFETCSLSTPDASGCEWRRGFASLSSPFPHPPHFLQMTMTHIFVAPTCCSTPSCRISPSPLFLEKCGGLLIKPLSFLLNPVSLSTVTKSCNFPSIGCSTQRILRFLSYLSLSPTVFFSRGDVDWSLKT